MAAKASTIPLILTALLTAAASPANATSNLSCTIDDANLAFTLEATTNREYGTIVGVAGGTLKVKASRAGKLVREFPVDKEHISQQWTFEQELRIGVNIEPDDGSIYLAIVAQSGRQNRDRYTGRYVLKIGQPEGTIELKGRIKGCSAEG